MNCVITPYTRQPLKRHMPASLLSYSHSSLAGRSFNKSARRLMFGAGLLLSLATSLLSTSANAFLLQNLEAERVELTDYLDDGRWTLVMFWARDCVQCEEQKPAFEAFHQQHKDTDATVLGISTDGMENKPDIDALIAHNKPTYPNLVVFTDVFYRQYQEMTGKPFRTTPTFLLFDRQGNLRGNLYGYIDFAAISDYIASES